MQWLNGKKTTTITASDRAVLYGDAFFTTIKVRDNRIEHWPLHMERLSFSASRLMFPAINMNLVFDELHDFIAQQPESHGVIRLTLSRGSGVRGYTPPSEPCLSRLLQWSSTMPKAPKSVSMAILEASASINPTLAGIKHTNRLENVMAQDELEKNYQYDDFFDGLMLADDFIIGGSKSNIFFYVDNRWLTPKVDRAGVDGTVRRWFMGTQDNVHASRFGLDILERAQHCFVCNALTGLVPVGHLGKHRFTIYSDMARLQKDYEDSALIY